MKTLTPMDQLKNAHRATWNSGDYADVAQRYVMPVAEEVVRRADIGPDMVVLDVATGSGNAAIPAALAGGRVTGLDLAASLLEVAKRRADSEDVDVEWVEGDAEDLPFADETFDRVLSAIGVQFAPRHELAARELARVLRPGGLVVLASWTPAGFIGQFLKTVGPRMPKPPEGATPPPPWGDRDHVAELFAPSAVEFEFETRTVHFDHGSAAGFVDYMATNYGPLLKARERLTPEGTWEDLRSDLVALCERMNEARDGFRVASEYLVAVGRKPAR